MKFESDPTVNSVHEWEQVGKKPSFYTHAQCYPNPHLNAIKMEEGDYRSAQCNAH